MESLTRSEEAFSVKVSSTLNKDVRQFGKNFMFDGKSDTCWNSDQGSPQFVTIEFEGAVLVKEVRIRFQGGFVGKDTSLLASGRGQDSFRLLERFYPEDSNSLQSFPLSYDKPHAIYKLVFESSSDFYGRITIYHLELLGEKFID